MFFRLILPFFLLCGVAVAAPPAQLQKIEHKIVSTGSEEVVLHFSSVVEPKVFSISGKQPRLVFDFEGVGLQRVAKQLAPGSRMIKDVRMGIHQDGGMKARLVFDLHSLQGMKHTYSVNRSNNQLVIRFASAAAASAATQPKEDKGASAPRQTRIQGGAKEPASDRAGGEAVEKKEREAAQTVAGKKQEAQPQHAEASATPQKKDAVAKQNATVAKQDAAVTKQNATVAKQDAAVAKQDAAVASAKAPAEAKPDTASAPPALPANPPPAGETPPVAAVPTLPAAQDPNAATPAAPAPPAATPATPYLSAIQFDPDSPKGELVQFKLNGFYPPVLRSIETGTPQVVCEFNNLEIAPALQGPIKISGRHVKAIRVDKPTESGKVRVFIELEPNRSYDLQQVFFKEDNFFVLIVNASKS